MLCLFGEKSWVGLEPLLSYYSRIKYLVNDALRINDIKTNTAITIFSLDFCHSNIPSLRSISRLYKNRKSLCKVGAFAWGRGGGGLMEAVAFCYLHQAFTADKQWKLS